MTQSGLTVATVDMQMLTEALADSNGNIRWYFHADSGDVRPTGDWADGFADEDLEDEGWVPIEPEGGRAAFEDMEQFANAVGDVRARDLLLRALEGKGVFRRFRETLREFPELRESWQAWVTAREDARAIRWLLTGDYVNELDAELSFTVRRTAAATALDAVRGTGGPTFDVADAPAHWAEITTALEAGSTVALTSQGRAFAAISVYESSV